MTRESTYSISTFQRMVEASPIALILVNKHGIIAFANAFAENLFQYPKSELTGAPLETLIPERFRQGHSHYLKHFFANRENRQMGKGRDLFAIKKDGEEFPVEIGLNPIDTQKDEPLVLAVIIDITERKEAEILTQRHTQELERKNNELEQFNTIASHDLQEPLNTIISWTDFLKETLELEEDDEKNDMFDHILGATMRMKGLITGLLEYSRLGRDSELKKVDCNELVRSVEKDLSSAMEKSETQLEISDLPTIWGYQLELRLLFQNLISNAIKYRNEGIPPKITIQAEKVDNAWKFTVKDNGVGIDPKDHESIFGIFHRAKSADSVEGTGVGLAHCRKIVDMHHGTITVDSALGKGSTFTFTIPKLQP